MKEGQSHRMPVAYCATRPLGKAPGGDLRGRLLASPPEGQPRRQDNDRHQTDEQRVTTVSAMLGRSMAAITSSSVRPAGTLD